jgi:hypothetical protein
MKLDGWGKVCVAAELAVGMVACTVGLDWVHGLIHGVGERSGVSGSGKKE